MNLSDLSVKFNLGADEQKQQVETILRDLLPAGSYMVLLRNYGTGDARKANRAKEQSYQVVVTLRRTGREVALAKRESLEKYGFSVNQYGEIAVSEN